MRPTRRWLIALVLAPKRFLDWVYEPLPRSRPSRGQAMVHLRMGAVGQDSSRWMEIEEAECQQRDAALRRVR